MMRWILGLAVAVGLIGWGTYTVRLQQANRQLVNSLEADRQMAMNDAAYHANQTQTFLGKAMASGSTAQTIRYLSTVQQHAMAEGNAFGHLPIETNLVARGAQLIHQIGDLASSLANRQASGQSITEQDRTLLASVKKQGDAIAQDLANTIHQINATNTRLVKPATFSTNFLLRGYQGAMKPGVARASGGATPVAYTGTGFTSLTDTNKELPTLIYDGPFSEHVTKEPPRVAGAAVTQAQAEAKLPEFVPMGGNAKVTDRTEGAGRIPTFSFRVDRGAQNGQVSIDIAKAGGHLVQMINSRPMNESMIDLAGAKAKGTAFLTKLGLTSMVPTYGVAEDGSATIVYAWSNNGVVFYRDQVKLKIALDTGEIVGYDARQYLTAHHDRGALTPKVASKTAQTQVNASLAIRRVQLAAIPDNAGTGEILCWEFTGKMGDQDYLVYVNANSGNEQQILQLIETDQGSFTI